MVKLFYGQSGGGGPMRGLELIMWPEGQWEALMKTAPDGSHGRTGDTRTDGRTDMATLWLNWPSGADSVKFSQTFIQCISLLVQLFFWYPVWPEVSSHREAGFPGWDNIQHMDTAPFRLNQPRRWFSEKV